jgi:hypothetical protein
MHQYLHNTRHATKLLFDELAKEELDYDDLMRKRTDIEIKRQFGGRIDPQTYARMSPKEIQARTANHMREVGNLHQVADQVLTRIRDRSFSLAVLAGAILQMGRQGISYEWKVYQKAPQVRNIHDNPTLPIALVVFAGRNQALHFEEAKMKQKFVRDVLDALGLRHEAKKNLARDFLSHLGWRDYDAYLKDMQQLLPV